MGTWHVVRTKSCAEERAVWHLRNQGFEVYCPRYRKQVRHARKTQTVLRPLYPGYVFVKLDGKQQRWRSINATVGVLSLVQFGDTPCSVPTNLVDAIRAREDETGAVVLMSEDLKEGDRVCVRNGAFADYRALLEDVLDDRRVILLLDLMGRKVRVSVPMDILAKAS